MSQPASPTSGKWSPRQLSIRADSLFILCFLSYTCSYIGRKNLSACIPAMISEGIFDKTFAGTITTAYMLCYGIGQGVSGIVAARIKPKYLLGTGLLGAAICNFAMSLVSIPSLYPLIWAVNGVFHSMLWAPILRIFTDILPAGKREKAGVNISAACSVGAVLAYLIPALVLGLANWRVVFIVAGVILLTAYLAWVIGQRILRPYIAQREEICRAERENFSGKEFAVDSPDKNGKKHRKKHSLIGLFLASGLWLALFCLLCNGALRDAVETWAPTFLSEQFGLKESLAALTSVLIPIVTLLGPYASDYLHKKLIHNEIYTACILFVLATACIVGIYLTRESSAILCAVFMAICIASMFGTNHMFLTVIPYHFAPMGLSASISGVLNSVIYLATGAFSAAYGMIAERGGWNILILVWLGLGIGGILLSLLAGWLWGRRYPLLDKGKL